MKDTAILKKHIHEIIEYRAVLSNVLKRKVTLEQAMADWMEKGYAKKHRHRP
ncbi:hypothetical protein ACFL6I_02075 [candidate division KSB1 bacterium]